MEFLSSPELASQATALGQVLLMDLVLAGDNAVAVGLAAGGLPVKDRRKVILYGLGAAVVLRIAFALITTWLLGVIGLLLAGGVLLLWVCWKLWRELRSGRLMDLGPNEGSIGGAPSQKTMRQAITQIVVADVSMSLDNVLAVAGAARNHPWVLVAGLALSVTLMGVAAVFIARMLQRFPWFAYAGLLMIVYVAIKMIWEGGHQVAVAI